MSEDTYVVPLKLRARWQRALRWPLTLSRFHRAGVSWRMAWRLTHLSVWFPS